MVVVPEKEVHWLVVQSAPLVPPLLEQEQPKKEH